MLSDKRLLATLSAFSLLTLGAGIAKKVIGGKGEGSNGGKEGAELRAQEAAIGRELSKLEGLQGVLARRAEEMQVVSGASSCAT